MYPVYLDAFKNFTYLHVWNKKHADKYIRIRSITNQYPVKATHTTDQNMMKENGMSQVCMNSISIYLILSSKGLKNSLITNFNSVNSGLGFANQKFITKYVAAMKLPKAAIA